MNDKNTTSASLPELATKDEGTLKELFTEYLREHYSEAGGYDQNIDDDAISVTRHLGYVQLCLDFEEVDREILDNISSTVESNAFEGITLQRLFSYDSPRPNSDGDYECMVWAGDFEKGILLSAEMRVGEYNDENYDGRGEIYLQVGEPDKLRELFQKDLKNLAASSIEPLIHLQGRVLKNEGPLAPDLQGMFNQASIEALQQSPLWDAIRAKISGQALEEVVPQGKARKKPGL